MRVGILGGTGPAGRGVAARLGLAGHEVKLGSRSTQKAQRIAAELAQPGISGGRNIEAARFGDVVVLSVPWEAAIATAAKVEKAMSGKVLMSMANAVAFIDGKPEPVVPSSGSLALAVNVTVLPACTGLGLAPGPEMSTGGLFTPWVEDLEAWDVFP